MRVEDAYTTAEYAELTGYKRDTISELCRKGLIQPPPIKKGTEWLINKNAKVIHKRNPRTALRKSFAVLQKEGKRKRRRTNKRRANGTANGASDAAAG